MSGPNKSARNAKTCISVLLDWNDTRTFNFFLCEMSDNFCQLQFAAKRFCNISSMQRKSCQVAWG